MYVGIDIGGTNSRVAVVKSLDEIKFAESKRVQNTGDFSKDIEQLKSLIYEVTGTKKGDNQIRAIAVGLPGEINDEGTGVELYPALPGWNGQPISTILEEEFFCEVLVENNASIAGLGEAFFGAGQGKDFVFIIWGTGIGGTEIKTVRDQIEMFGFEPGHHIIWGDSDINEFEEFAGGRGINNWLGKPAEELSEDEWSEVCDKMSLGLTNVVCIRRTHTIILGGGIALKQSQRLPVVQEGMKKYMPQFFAIPEILASSLGDDAGLYGAFALIKRDAKINSRLQRVYG